MELLDLLKNNSKISDLERTANYYYEHHSCQSGKDERIMLDYIISSETDDEIIRFGICPRCGKCFYYSDYVSKHF